MKISKYACGHVLLENGVGASRRVKPGGLPVFFKFGPLRDLSLSIIFPDLYILVWCLISNLKAM